MHKTDIYMTASYLFQHWFWDISISDWPVLVTFSFLSQFWLTNSSLHDFAWIKKVEISPQWHFTVIRNTVRRDGDNNFDEILGFWNILCLRGLDDVLIVRRSSKQQKIINFSIIYLSTISRNDVIMKKHLATLPQAFHQIY